MSAERVSSTETVIVFVRLLDEGTDVWRPTRAHQLPGGLYRLLPSEGYDPEDEDWEFPPGCTVACELQAKSGEKVLVAIRQV